MTGPLPHCDVTSLDYWSSRVAEYAAKGDFEGMLFEDCCRGEFWKHARSILLPWCQSSVVDVACGHGQFASLFPPDRYIGIDFCGAMVELARERHPQHRFELSTFGAFAAWASGSDNPADVVFQVNSLRSMGMKVDEFRALGEALSRRAVISIEKDEARIWTRWN